ncbi:FtsK/SpoIIIE domain-containing protein [Cytobacillus oceanisediminis]|uniref:FtsK/SpoIIIE domain-containing protein n=1 Tax=Cytobacillus oceanisediminis TaxID=665099 RepID=UPI00203A9B7C|nr:FtsK/SpoIIIE domain-containing protein [Cytobacillus oceanisediminis]
MSLIKEWFAKQQAKAALLKVFKDGDIGISYSYGQNKGMVYPKIRSVKLDYENQAVIYTFSIPTGLDPKDVKKKEYCFQQVFGKHIELKGEIKEFKLTVYAAVLPSVLKFDYEAYVPHFQDYKIPIVAGIDINGNIIVYDMVKNPHLLIAGETGSGKSTQLRSVLTTLIKALPAERLELYLCDLKRSEFHLFRHVEHVRGLFVSPREMMPMLQYLQKEMQSRGDLLDFYEVSHIDDLEQPPPYIVLCIDEVALLQNEKKLMELVEEISAIGRALGVFLILSMQRPDRKVLDGKLKNNLTVRMGFKCADAINSRIIGTPGSEKLKKEGRMLLKLPVYSDPKEIQAPYLELDKAKKLLEPYKSIKGKNAKFTPSKPPGEVVDTKETENNIFEVLD